MAIPTLFNVTYFGIRDITPFSTLIANLFLFYAIWKMKVLSLLPIARESILENIEQGICVFDSKYHLIDLNQKMRDILNFDSSLSMYGKTFREIFETWKDLPPLVDEFEDRKKNLSSWIIHYQKKYYKITKRNLYRGKNPDEDVIGLLIQFHDITEILQVEELRITKRELEKKTQVLEKALAEKQILIKEIHHRVKNNLQIISGILTLHDYYSDNPNEIKLIQEFQHRIKAMSKIHEKIYLSENVQEISAKEYIHDIVLNVEQVYHQPMKKEINFHITGDDINIDLSTGLHIGLIINELVSNSYKHAFGNVTNGNIYINLEKQKDYVILMVKDNGIGFPAKKVPKDTESLGMKIISTSAQQLNAKFSFKSNNGLVFSMKFKY
jgi:two-component sensor histidine kinase